MSSIRFTVVIPTYNRLKYLPRALKSVLEQTYDNYEVLVIDDGSTDETGSWIQPYLNDSDKVRYLKSVNMGACVARNIGISLARGEWISFLDSDDYFAAEKLELLHRAIQKAENDQWKAFYHGKITTHGEVNYTDEDGRPVQVDKDNVYDRNYIGGCSVFTASRKALLKVGGFDIQFKSRQDLDLYVRIIQFCDFVYLPEILATIDRSNDDNIGKDRLSKMHAHVHFYQKHKTKMSAQQRKAIAKRIIFFAQKSNRPLTALKFLPVYSSLTY